MTKQQIIHHISKRLEFLLNHSDGADRNLNADKITELSALLRDITMDDENTPMSMGNTFNYSSEPHPARPTSARNRRLEDRDENAPRYSGVDSVSTLGGSGTVTMSSGIA